MQAGDTLLITLERTQSIPHLWVVVTNPDERGQLLIVSITTLRHNVDQTVVLQRGDHPFVRHQSSVFFGDSMIVSEERLEQWRLAGVASAEEPCRADILRLIQDGVLVSDYTPRKIIAFFQRALAHQRP